MARPLLIHCDIAPTRLARLRAWTGLVAYVWLLVGPGLEASTEARVVQACATLLIAGRSAWFRRVTMYRLRVTEKCLMERRWPGRWTSISHGDLVGFAERVKTWFGMPDGFDFAFRAGDGRQITLTTDIPGWARCILVEHRFRPGVVPHPRFLAARRVMLVEGLEEFAETVRSPGQDIPEEWKWARRPRRRDFLIGLAAGYFLLLPVARRARAWAMGAFEVEEGLVVLAVFVLHLVTACAGGIALQTRARARRVARLNVENLIRRIEDPDEPPIRRI